MSVLKDLMDGAKNKFRLIGMTVVIAILVGLLVVLFVRFANDEKKPPEVINGATLTKMVQISELSSYTAVYNGIATINDPEDPEEIAYYVSYKAKVNAGFDMKDLEISVDAETKVITIDVPEIGLMECNVDFSSMDFIYMDDDFDTSTVSADAYKACIADLEQECRKEDVIFELAEENAINHIKALLTPLIEQLDEPYTLEFE